MQFRGSRRRRFVPFVAVVAALVAVGNPQPFERVRAQEAPPTSDASRAPVASASPTPAARAATPLASAPPATSTTGAPPVATASPGIGVPPTGAPAPDGSPAATPVPGAPASPAPGAGAVPVPAPPPTPIPTPPPIIVDPPQAGITPGGTERLRVEQELGTLTVVAADPTIVDASIDQEARELVVVGKKLGATTVTVTDARGLTRDVPVRVAYPAGEVASDTSVRITGNPATQLFIREQALAAATAATTVRPGASIVASQESINVPAPLRVDDVTTIDVPIIVSGDGFFTVQGTTHVRVENFAEPPIAPRALLVSDFPERLTETGILFTADLIAKQAERFLYYHYNPAGQPDRRIVLKVRNPSSQPALVQFINGAAGPDLNEMQVGHLSTQRFLVRRAQNEGTVVTIPGNATISLAQQPLPARSLVSALMQINEIDGPPLHLTLVAQNADDPIDGPIPESALLVGDRPHARGVYPIPEFFFDYSYDADGPDLEIPIGQIPLPNLVEGQTLAGDYGVLQSITLRIVNNDRRNARQIAVYANPRGGRATGTFLIDRELVQAHQMAAFGTYKLRQYTIAPGSFVRTEIVTIPEGGSSYPLRLVVAPDDGSAAPGTADSPVY